MNPEPTTISHACDASTIGDLLAASIVALQAAIQTDLPPMTTLLPLPGATRDLPQGVRRDLHAAESLYGIHFGPMRVVTQRPEAADTRTLVIPQGDGHKIIVLCVSGSAAVYAPIGRQAALDRVIPVVAGAMLDAWAVCLRRLPNARLLAPDQCGVLLLRPCIACIPQEHLNKSKDIAS